MNTLHSELEILDLPLFATAQPINRNSQPRAIFQIPRLIIQAEQIINGITKPEISLARSALVPFTPELSTITSAHLTLLNPQSFTLNPPINSN